MATYAAYRHIELDNVGYGKKRVLKPPGGGTSDIFGVGSQSDGGARRVKNHLASNVFLSDDPSPSPTPKTPGKSTHSRLFGPPSPPKSASMSPKSDNNITNVSSNGNSPPSTPKKSAMNGDSHHDEGDHVSNGNVSPTTNGNRITNGGTTNGSPAANGTPTAAPRQRVPPGGFSSGLW